VLKVLSLLYALGGNAVDQARIRVPELYDQLVKSAAEIEAEAIKTSKDLAEEVVEEGKLLTSTPEPKIARALSSTASGAGEGAAGSLARAGASKLLPVAATAGAGAAIMILTNPMDNTVPAAACKVEQCPAGTKIDQGRPE
jgi:hypothetical protein